MPERYLEKDFQEFMAMVLEYISWYDQCN